MLAIVTRLQPEFGHRCGPLIPSASKHETNREALSGFISQTRQCEFLLEFVEPFRFSFRFPTIHEVSRSL